MEYPIVTISTPVRRWTSRRNLTPVRRLRNRRSGNPLPSARQRRPSDSDQPQAHRLGPLLTVGHVDGDALSFRQAHDPGTVQRRGVHEDILAALIGADEAKPLGGVVPLYGAKFLDRGSIDIRICRAFRPCPPRLLLRCSAGIHTDDLRPLRPLRSGPGTHLERRAERHAAMAAALNYAHMQESVTRTVGQFNEAEALIRVVPLDGRSDGRAGGAVELWTARRRISEITG